jgi:serine/threonine-protein kinase
MASSSESKPLDPTPPAVPSDRPDDSPIEATSRMNPPTSPPTLPTGGAVSDVSPVHRPAQVGRFAPVRLHARGGLGEVHLAMDTELNRPVAFKSIRSEFAHQRDSRSRFLREASITALLEHPGIVPVYGLVHDAQGVPSYSMRFIEGDTLQVAIKRFHAAPGAARDPERRLDFRKLLGHFCAVCDTIRYAHSRGVIHRDLKPSNILLGRFGETLVVDWGLAKVVEGGAVRVEEEPTLLSSSTLPSSRSPSPETEATQLGQALGTPGYMSPEQAAGRWNVVGPASDVYSLGATLCCLLTGKPPVSGTSAPEVLAKVQRGDVVWPCQTDPATPPALDAICRKAMALEPAARYQTAGELAAEVQRWLADEPVSVYRESAPARLARWARRQRTTAVGLAVALLVGALSLAVATVLLTAANVRERTARRDAQTERDEARQQRERADANLARARDAVDKYLTRVAEDDRLKQTDLHALRKDLLATAVPFYEEFARQEADVPERLADQGKAYLSLALVRDELGEPQAAAAGYRRAEEVFARLAAEHPTVPEHRYKWATSQSRRGILLFRTGQTVESEKVFRQALGILQELVKEKSDILLYCRQLGLCHNSLGIVLAAQNQREKAEGEYRVALAIQEAQVEAHPTEPLCRQDLSKTLNNRALLLWDQGERARAVEAFERAQRCLQQLADASPSVATYRNDLASCLFNLGMLRKEMGQQVEAEKDLRHALRLQQALTTAFPAVPDYRYDQAGTWNTLGNLLSAQGKSAQAEDAYRQALPLQQSLVDLFPAIPDYRANLAATHHSLGAFFRDQGKWKAAEGEYRQAVRIRQELADKFPAVANYRAELGSSLADLGHLVRDQDNPQASLDWYVQAIKILQPLYEADSRDVSARKYLSETYEGRGHARSSLGQHADALADMDRAVQVAEDSTRPLCQASRALCRARAGTVGRAVAEAEELRKQKDLASMALYNTACVFAVCAGKAGTEKDREVHAARAVEVLQQAVARGYQDVGHLQKDPDLNALRKRPDFQQLLKELEAKPVPSRQP